MYRTLLRMLPCAVLLMCGSTTFVCGYTRVLIPIINDTGYDLHVEMDGQDKGEVPKGEQYTFKEEVPDSFTVYVMKWNDIEEKNHIVSKKYELESFTGDKAFAVGLRGDIESNDARLVINEISLNN